MAITSATMQDRDLREALRLCEGCPFCGKPPVMFQDANLGGFESIVVLRCNECSVSMNTNARNGHEGIVRMIRRWNARHAKTVEVPVSKFHPIEDEL